MAEKTDGGLYHKYRPKTLAELVGQEAAVKALQSMADKKRIPQVVLLTGPSGTGKTTVARILKNMVGCKDTGYTELNCAIVDSPIDTIRKIEKQMGMRPLGGGSKVYYLDEIQAWSKAGFAQQAILKILEDTPKGVYFFMAASDSSKVIEAIKTRSTAIKFQALSSDHLTTLMKKVVKAEKAKVSDEILDQIATASNGSARQALVLLDKVRELPPAEQSAVINVEEENTNAFAIFRRLMGWDKAKPPLWSNVAPLLQNLDEDPEGVRRAIMTIASTICLKADGSANRAAWVMKSFQFDTFATGKAGLVLAAFECCQAFAGKAK